MKIAYKIHITNLFAIIFIVLVGFFSYRNLNMVLAKLRFIEIADDLNASFLETRLNEKNYFLYHHEFTLKALRSRLTESIGRLDSMKSAIIRATGEENYDRLKLSCTDYLEHLQKIEPGKPLDESIQASVREAGQKLREFSNHITGLERKKTNEIILKAKRELFTTLCFVLVSAIGISYLFFFNILKSLNKIKKVAKAISNGKFGGFDTEIPKDEVGSVLKAVNLMAGELANREEQIIQSKKLASIGILTAGVAHELGNPLNNISMVAQTYLEFYQTLSEEERIGFMKMVEDEADRIKDIVTNLLDFSRPKKLNMELCDINAIVEKCLKLVRNLITISNIDVELSFGEELPKPFVDKNRILEVLVNIVTNAIHAMPQRGRLSIVTQPAGDDGYVEILVTDTGKGIPAELLPNLFDPFFSTKGAQGTGLGLFVSYGIINNHGGTLSVNSEVGKGTTFTIALPAYDKMPDTELDNGLGQPS